MSYQSAFFRLIEMNVRWGRYLHFRRWLRRPAGYGLGRGLVGKGRKRAFRCRKQIGNRFTHWELSGGEAVLGAVSAALPEPLLGRQACYGFGRELFGKLSAPALRCRRSHPASSTRFEARGEKPLMCSGSL